MKALLRRLGLAPPPAALHRKWLDGLCRPAPPSAGRVPDGLAPPDGGFTPPSRLLAQGRRPGHARFPLDPEE